MSSFFDCFIIIWLGLVVGTVLIVFKVHQFSWYGGLLHTQMFEVFGICSSPGGLICSLWVLFGSLGDCILVWLGARV